MLFLVASQFCELESCVAWVASHSLCCFGTWSWQAILPQHPSAEMEGAALGSPLAVLRIHVRILDLEEFLLEKIKELYL